MTESIKFIHKVLYQDIPKAITKLISYSLERSDIMRLTRKPLVIVKSNSKRLSQSVIYRSIFLYNKLSDTIRN